MKTLLVTLNAKYIHRSLAVRLLYVASREGRDVEFEEFTIKESPEDVAAQITARHPDVVGLGVYIWNVEQTRRIVMLLREAMPEVKIILGGPEVSYEPEFFISEWPVDYVVGGDGEFVFGRLLDAIAAGEVADMAGVSRRGHISREVLRADPELVAALPSPYMLPQDKESLPHQMIYFETSRGCPYSCAYCLSSLEKGVVRFPEKYVAENLEYLINNGARKIKFLDRTFNSDIRTTRRVFDLLIGLHRPGVSCQFEVYADVMPREVIEYLNERLPDDFFRFEIGIQSTHAAANEAVARRQNFERLSQNIRLITSGGKIELHLDLIAGLPYETFNTFGRSFDDVFAFGAAELQMGFLKMLRGTALRRDAGRYGYVYSTEAPYQVLSNDFISAGELERLDDTEFVLDKYWNSRRFPRTMRAVFGTERYGGKYFDFFDRLGQHYRRNEFSRRGYRLDELFARLHSFLMEQGIDLSGLLRDDYYDCFGQRPNTHFLPRPDKGDLKRLVAKIVADTGFMHANDLSPHQVQKQSVVDVADGKVLITIFEGRGILPQRVEYL